MITITTSIQHYTAGSNTRKRKKRYKDYKRANETIIIHEWYDCTGRKSKGIHRKLIRISEFSSHWIQDEKYQNQLYFYTTENKNFKIIPMIAFKY